MWMRLGKVLSLIALICIVFLNIALLRQNHSLKERIRQSAFRDFDPSRRLASFGGVDLEGRFRELQLGFSKNKYLLIEFSTGCPYSRRNMNKWIKLENKALKHGWMPVWVSSDPTFVTGEFCREYSIKGLVLSGLSCRDFNRLGLNFVPRTLAVDGSGRVLQYWEGEISSAKWPQVFEYFSSPVVRAQ